MSIGLSKKEIYGLLSFVGSPKEIADFIFPGSEKPNSMEDIAAGVVRAILIKVSEGILANNKRIEEQLTAAGIHLAD